MSKVNMLHLKIKRRKYVTSSKMAPIENIYSTPGCTMLMVHPRLFSPNEQNERMSKWVKWTNEQMSKHFYSFKKMSKHFYYKMSKMSRWVNEQNVHMSKFGVKWASEILIYYKNTPGCTMLMVHPGVPWVNSAPIGMLLWHIQVKKNTF